jgi:hypothetical protein
MAVAAAAVVAGVFGGTGFAASGASNNRCNALSNQYHDVRVRLATATNPHQVKVLTNKADRVRQQLVRACAGA